MNATLQERRVLRAFADLFDYPTDDPAPDARHCRDLVEGRPAAAHLEAFLSRVERAGAHEMEEIYASTFDLDPACAPYVGHHLAGETPKRGLFMAHLARAYREDGFDGAAGELPDHIAVVLRYLAVAPEGPSRTAVLSDALVPALEKMSASMPPSDDAWRHVLAALRAEVSP